MKNNSPLFRKIEKSGLFNETTLECIVKDINHLAIKLGENNEVLEVDLISSEENRISLFSKTKNPLTKETIKDLLNCDVLEIERYFTYTFLRVFKYQVTEIIY